MTQINLEDALEAVDVAMLGAYRPTFERVVKALRALPSVPTPDVSPVPPTAWSSENLEMARLFHDVYEEEAARLGWQSQTPVSFDELPEANKQTMLHTVARVRSRIAKTVYSELIEKINELESSAHPVAPTPDELQKLVDEQAEDEMLWFVTENITEAYLQQELRRLHAAIENRPDVSPVPPTAREKIEQRMSDEMLEQIALFIENSGNSAYKGSDWHSAPGYMAAARIVRRYKAGGDLATDTLAAPPVGTQE